MRILSLKLLKQPETEMRLNVTVGTEFEKND